MQRKHKTTICPEDHKHELTTVCHEHHKCRCQWCVSEARARYQERMGTNGLWTKEELIIEVEHLSNCGMGPQQIADALGQTLEHTRHQLRKYGRKDLSEKLFLASI